MSTVTSLARNLGGSVQEITTTTFFSEAADFALDSIVETAQLATQCAEQFLDIGNQKLKKNCHPFLNAMGTDLGALNVGVGGCHFDLGVGGGGQLAQRKQAGEGDDNFHHFNACWFDEASKQYDLIVARQPA